VGNTARLIVTSRGRTPGTFAVQMALPVRAKLQLAAASGPVTVSAIGR
jgi:hypothetical protein